MTDNGYLDRLESWVAKVVEESERLPEDMSEEELREQEASWYADFFTLEDGWLVASPDDPAMRERLTGEEGMSPDFADEVLTKMREMGAARSAV
jgi:hypothetical protein